MQVEESALELNFDLSIREKVYNLQTRKIQLGILLMEESIDERVMRMTDECLI